MPSRLLPKHVWKNAVGASKKSKRLHLLADSDGLFHCPVIYCDSMPFRSQRGCRKHVFQRHGWYYYFEKKPIVEEVLPQESIKRNALCKAQRKNTVDMPAFHKTCTLYKEFKKWICSYGGGSKGDNQADQICTRVLKYLKFCCEDNDPSWDIPNTVVDYCIGSITVLSDFVSFLRDMWKVGFAGMIGYLQAISHLIDFRRIYSKNNEKVESFIASEVYIERVKKTLSKKMRSEWNVLLSVDYLTQNGWWATLEEMQQVIPYHGDRFAQILLNASVETTCVPANDLSFCTAYIVAVLFIMVKASRPMTYQYLTVAMIKNISPDGIIDQTVFKTQDKYGFDSLIFSQQVIDIINGYVTCIRSRLNPKCDYLLISRNGSQLTRLSVVFGMLVYQAIGKYINPTRYRQMIETESAAKLSITEQSALSEDQKHTSCVAKVHYKKVQSRNIAEKGRQCMNKLRDESSSLDMLQTINDQLLDKGSNMTDFEVVSNKTQTGETGQCTNLFQNNEQKSKRQKKIPFSAIEDNYLKAGVKKYGSKWKKILSDSEYKFHPSRQPATLCTRAKLCKYI